VHARDDGLRRAAHEDRELADAALQAQRPGDPRLGARRILQVEPGAERAARPAQDHDARGALLAQAREEVAQLRHERLVHGVELLWAVQREPGDRPLAAEIERRVGHGASGFAPRARGSASTRPGRAPGP
jgi:hypothetical protein